MPSGNQRKRSVHCAVATLAALTLGVTGTLSASASAEPGTESGKNSAESGTTPTGLPYTDLDTRGDGYPVYRIPGLTKTKAGTLIGTYDGRPTDADVPGNIALVLRRSTDDGKTWQQRQVVRYEQGKAGYGDPSVVVDRETGRIFIFHVASVNQGYFGSHTGNDENDPDVLQMDYSYSDDDGLTWKHERITKEAKNPAWGGLFASSGEGIQIKHGTYAGRLVQQYAIRHEGGNWAASLYSDDHGKSWKFGELVGPGMDENKTVELSDGRIMLNSRAPGGYRKVAFSSDGGQTYTQPRQDKQLIDPTNNASIIRHNLDAASGPEAEKLLFSNTASQSSRKNLTVKQSCDNGRTWPISKTVDPGNVAYSTLTPLGDGKFGLLYEKSIRDDGRITSIRYTSFDDAWLGGVCAPLTATAPDEAAAGGTTDVTVEVTNQEPSTLKNGKVALDLPAGWTAPEVSVPTLRSGASTKVTVSVSAPDDAATNAHPFTARFTGAGGESATKGSILVRGATGS